ncbi:hypothetical protein [Maribacter sp.]|nr:hypothetical protein [Maribacter sp.]
MIIYEYKIIDNSPENELTKEGKATLQQLKVILPQDVYERLFIPGTISIK